MTMDGGWMVLKEWKQIKKCHCHGTTASVRVRGKLMASSLPGSERGGSVASGGAAAAVPWRVSPKRSSHVSRACEQINEA